ncbi:MAG: calcium/sodium antiporter [Muribaculaceae bacterium]|nr:calcium/sodium antiporter [Muribaculaceae bacterium]
MDYLYLILGLALLLLAANYLVESSVAIARRAHISSFIIGLTIVGIGTSAPELFITIASALGDKGDIAMGNVVGSNIANILLVMGLTAAITPFAIERVQQRRDIPICIVAAALLLLLANDKIIPGIDENTISRIDAGLLLLLFAVYMLKIVKSRKSGDMAEEEDEATSSLDGKHPALLWTIAIVSLAALIGGGDLFLDSAQNLARAWGMSDAVISITIVAVGTSLPELITAVVAASKHNPQLALGNVIGSCVFNILMIVGVGAMFKPLALSSIQLADYGVMLAASIGLAIVVFTFGRNRFDRIEGFLFLAAYAGYTVYLLFR